MSEKMREKIFKAADSLLSRGHEPMKITQKMVREALGGGSQTDISRYLREWKAIKQDILLKNVSKIPEEFDSLMKTFTGSLWRSLETYFIDRANQHITSELENQVKTTESAIDELQGAKEKILTLVTENAQLKKQLEDVQRELKASQSETKKHLIELSKVRNENITLEIITQKLDELSKRK